MSRLAISMLVSLIGSLALADSYTAIPFDVAHFGQAVVSLEIQKKEGGIAVCTGFLDEK